MPRDCSGAGARAAGSGGCDRRRGNATISAADTGDAGATGDMHVGRGRGGGEGRARSDDGCRLRWRTPEGRRKAEEQVFVGGRSSGSSVAGGAECKARCGRMNGGGRMVVMVMVGIAHGREAVNHSAAAAIPSWRRFAFGGSPHAVVVILVVVLIIITIVIIAIASTVIGSSSREHGVGRRHKVGQRLPQPGYRSALAARPRRRLAFCGARRRLLVLAVAAPGAGVLAFEAGPDTDVRIRYSNCAHSCCAGSLAALLRIGKGGLGSSAIEIQAIVVVVVVRIVVLN